MLLMCYAQAYSDWKGEVGNYLVLVIFVVAALINVTVAICFILITSPDTRLQNYLTIKFFCGNISVATSQICISILQLNDALTCERKVMVYLFHQIGMMTATSSLLTLIFCHYKHVQKLYELSPRLRQRCLKKTVILQITLDVLGIVLICLPIFILHKVYAHYFNMAFNILLNITLVVYCLLDKHIMNIRTSSARSGYMENLTGTFRYLYPIIWTTALLKVYFIFIQLGPYIFNTKENVLRLVALRWAGMFYYISVILIPVIIIFKNPQIQNRICCRSASGGDDVEVTIPNGDSGVYRGNHVHPTTEAAVHIERSSTEKEASEKKKDSSADEICEDTV